MGELDVISAISADFALMAKLCNDHGDHVVWPLPYLYLWR